MMATCLLYKKLQNKATTKKTQGKDKRPLSVTFKYKISIYFEVSSSSCRCLVIKWL
jgi:hypothetical protein